MTRISKSEKAKQKLEFEIRRRREEVDTIREALKRDPLYRENLRTGFDYDTGDPFRDFAYHLVNGYHKENIVLKTSGGLIFEATSKQMMYKNKESDKIELLERFDPTKSIYPIEAPYFTKIARALSTCIHNALSKRESITLETNVENPFGEKGK